MKKMKKIYASLLIALMLFSYMPPLINVVKAETIQDCLEFTTTTTTYNVGDTITIDVKVKNIGDLTVDQFIASIEYDNTALEFQSVTTIEGYTNQSATSGNSGSAQIYNSVPGGKHGTVGEGGIIGQIVFKALKSSKTSTTIRMTEIDGTMSDRSLWSYYGDVDDNIIAPTITLPLQADKQTHNMTVKLTNESGTALEGAIFKFTALDGTTQLLETAADGTFNLADLQMPTGAGPFVYTIEQKTAPDGYVKNTAPSTITVTFDSDGNVQSVVGANATATNSGNDITTIITNEAEIHVEQETFYMELTKVDELNNIITTDSATFEISSPVAADKTASTTAGKTTQIEFKAPVEAGTYPYVIKETKAPSGYNQTPDNVILDLKFENISNVITLTSCNIVSYGKTATIDTSTGSKVIKMDIVNEKEVVTTKYDYTINIDKVKNDSLKTRITTDTAGFSVTYDGKSEYIKTNALGKATYNFSLNSDEIETSKTYTYTIEEVKAPDGYVLDSTAQTVNLTFNADGTINTMAVSGSKIIKVNAASKDVNVQIVNEEEPAPVVLTPETFNLVLNKQDTHGNLITTDSATFNLIAPDGTKTSYTTTSGVTANISLTAPNAAGKQVYLVQETKAPAGYEKISGSVAIEMTFVENSGKVVLSSAVLKGDTDTNLTPTTVGGVNTLSVNIQNEKITKYYIGITNEDKDSGTALSGAVFKATNTTTSEYGYIDNNKLEVDMPNAAGTVVYTIDQVNAQSGYKVSENQTTLSLDFRADSTGNIYLYSYTVTGADAEKVTTTDLNTAMLKIKNEKEQEEVVITKDIYSIEITKVDSSTGATITDAAVFDIMPTTGKTYTTVNGVITINNLAAGDTDLFVIKEKSAPAGYELLDESIAVSLTSAENSNNISLTGVNVEMGASVAEAKLESGVLKIKIKNTKQVVDPTITKEPYSMEITKVDGSTNTIITDVAKFDVTEETAKTEYSTTDGKITITNLQPGENGTNKTFIITETEAPTGYEKLEQSVAVNVSYKEIANRLQASSVTLVAGNDVATATLTGGVVKVTIKNTKETVPPVITKEPYAIEITKVDASTGATITDVAKFDITEGTTKTGHSTTSGKVTIQNIQPGEHGTNRTYIITETQAPTGYEKLKQSVAVNVGFTENANTLKATSVTLTSGNDVATATLNGGIVKITIKNTKEVVPPVITKKPYSVEITKVDNSTGATITNPAAFEVALGDTLTPYTTNRGIITIPNLTPGDNDVTFVITETQEPTGYEKLTKSVVANVSFKTEGNEQKVDKVTITSGSNVATASVQNGIVKIKVKNTAKAVNPTITKENYEVKVLKQDAETNANISEPATFSVALGNAKTPYTTSNGKFEMKNLVPGEDGSIATYVITEEQAPTGYEKLKQSIVLNVSFAQEGNVLKAKAASIVAGGDIATATLNAGVVEVVVKNTKEVIPPTITKEPYSIEITKVDSDTGSTILEQAGFDITEGITTNAYTTNQGIITIANLNPGENGTNKVFVITETQEPDGYKKLEKAIALNVKYTQSGNTLKASEVSILAGDDVAEAILDNGVVKVKIKNTLKEPEDLYVKSKKGSDGNYLYDVLQSYDGVHYSIANPFIDTRIPKSGNNITIQQFIDNLDSNGVLTVWDEDGNQLPTTGKVKTKMILKANKDAQEMTFTIVIKGDADGDGRVRSKDLDKLIKHLSGEQEETDVYFLRALDMYDDGGDGRIRSTDLNRFYQVLAK